MLSWLLFGWSIAQESPGPDLGERAEEDAGGPAGEDAGEPVDLEIWVLDERTARREVEAALAAEGYQKIERRGPWRIYDVGGAWRPRIAVHDEGFMVVKRPITNQVFLKLMGDWRSSLARQARTVDAVQDDVARWRSAQQQGRFAERLAVLPERLEGLWRHGVAWEASDPHFPAARPLVATEPERHRVLLDLWATRTDTPEGRLVRDQIARFLVHEVWPFHPPSADEIASANARCDCAPLTLP